MVGPGTLIAECSHPHNSLHVVAKQYLDAARLALLCLFACFKLHAASKASCPQAIIARCMEHIAQLACHEHAVRGLAGGCFLGRAIFAWGIHDASSDDQCALCDLQSIRRSTRFKHCLRW